MNATITNADKLEYKYNMDKAISQYIAVCVGNAGGDTDFSAIGDEIDWAIQLMGGEPAQDC